MTPEDVRNRVATIDNIRHDHEAAHATEDDLYRDVLERIAEGTPQAAELAEEALRTKDIDFARWCA